VFVVSFRNLLFLLQGCEFNCTIIVLLITAIEFVATEKGTHFPGTLREIESAALDIK